MDELGIEPHVSPVPLLMHFIAEPSVRNRPLMQSSPKSQL